MAAKCTLRSDNFIFRGYGDKTYGMILACSFLFGVSKFLFDAGIGKDEFEQMRCTVDGEECLLVCWCLLIVLLPKVIPSLMLL